MKLDVEDNPVKVGTGPATKRMTRRTVFISVTVIVLISLFRAGTIFDYSFFAIDEQLIVDRAVGFLGGDLHPRWFVYHTLPMYLLAAVYYLLYVFSIMFGLVGSKVEFASLLYDHNDFFFITARIVSSIAYTLGCAVLARIVYLRSSSAIWTLVFFLIANFLPDAVLASNHARVDSFVFLFFSLTIYFSCFAPKSARSFVLSVLCCAAAVASKLPAITVGGVLLVQLFVDVRKGIYPKLYLLYFFGLFPLFVFAFMPFAFLDFESYGQALSRISSRVSGTLFQAGREHYATLGERFFGVFSLVRFQVGLVGIAGTCLFAVRALRSGKSLLVPFLAVCFYAGTFATSHSIESYWLRPVYPFLTLFTVIFIMESSSMVRISRFDSAARFILPTLLALYFGLVFYESKVGHLRVLRKEGEDTRRVAARWIENNLSANATILLDGATLHYYPRVLPKDTVLARIFPLGVSARFVGSRLLSDAFHVYYERATRRRKPFDVRIYPCEFDATGFRRPGLPRVGEYLILSESFMYRFTYPSTVSAFPALAANAKKFYDYADRQETVQEFHGIGPVLRILRIKEVESFPVDILASEIK